MNARMKTAALLLMTNLLPATLAAEETPAAPPSSSSSSAGGYPWKFSGYLEYASGDYGTNTRTSSVYIPFTLRRYLSGGNVGLTLPYVSETTNGRVVNVGGVPLRVRRGRGSTTTSTESGLGDMLLTGRYYAMEEGEQPFDLTLFGKIKIPTASRDDGLGTGEFDEGVGLEAAKEAAPGWTLLGDLYYTAIGDPPGMDLNDQYAVDFGFLHPLQQDLALTVLYEESTALVPGAPRPRDLRGILERRLDKTSSVFGGLLVGLSDGSPDFGFSVGGGLRF